MTKTAGVTGALSHSSCAEHCCECCWRCPAGVSVVLDKETTLATHGMPPLECAWRCSLTAWTLAGQLPEIFAVPNLPGDKQCAQPSAVQHPAPDFGCHQAGTPRRAGAPVLSAALHHSRQILAAMSALEGCCITRASCCGVCTETAVLQASRPSPACCAGSRATPWWALQPASLQASGQLHPWCRPQATGWARCEPLLRV